MTFYIIRIKSAIRNKKKEGKGKVSGERWHPYNTWTDRDNGELIPGTMWCLSAVHTNLYINRWCGFWVGFLCICICNYPLVIVIINWLLNASTVTLFWATLSSIKNGSKCFTGLDSSITYTAQHLQTIQMRTCMEWLVWVKLKIDIFFLVQK